jgi:UDP-2-acetamido-3-amino-2,3-dideoxy-glucuronate N-acetyltransferase
MAVFDDTAPWPEKLVLYPHRVEWISGRVPVASKAEAIAHPLAPSEPLLAECQHFLACVAEGRRPLTDGKSGCDVLRILDAGTRSLSQRGVPVAVSAGGSDAAPEVHPTAVVDDGATVGPGTRIWHFSHVMAGSRIGRGCTLGQGVFVGRGVTVGDGVKIQNNVSVFEGVELEDEVFCGPSMVFTNVVNPRSAVERKDEFRRTLVRRGATLGANSTIVCGVTVGRFAMVGAGATVTSDVPDHALVVGTPARVAGWRCVCGEAVDLGADTGTACDACRRQYQVCASGLREISSEPSAARVPTDWAASTDDLAGLSRALRG